MRALAAVLLLVLVGAANAWSHEFWIEPSTFAPEPGERVSVHLRVGDASEGERDEMARRSDHLLRFEAIGAKGTAPILGVLGRAPAGLLRTSEPGELVLIYQGKHTFIDLPAEKFESYLEEEGLSRVIEARVRAGETLSPGRESYARYAKSVIRVQGARDGDAERVFHREIGLPIEVIPETDPIAWEDGDPFSVRVVYDGKPLADQQVKLIHLVDHELKVLARTNAKGRVKLKPPQPGPWLVATVYMRRASEPLEGDWESFWGSLTFDLPGEPH